MDQVLEKKKTPARNMISKAAMEIKREAQQTKKDAEKKAETEAKITKAIEDKAKKQDVEKMKVENEVKKAEEEKVRAAEEESRTKEKMNEETIGTTPISGTTAKQTNEVKADSKNSLALNTEKIDSEDPKGYAFKSERKENSAEKVMDPTNEGTIFLKKEYSFSLFGLGSPYLKRTLTPESGVMIYYGELKENMPSGFGVLLEESDSDFENSIYVIRYIGNFKKGKFEGFGRLYADATNYYSNMLSNESFNDMRKFGITYLKYEGYFKSNKFDGEGNFFIIEENASSEVLAPMLKSYMEENADILKEIVNEWSSENSPLIFSSLPPLKSIIQDTGIFEKDELNGHAKTYYHGGLIYEGGYKDGEFRGKGKLYFENGNLRYDGELKGGKFHGKGTFYKEDMSVVYIGEWSNGDVK
jgi:hypothetical protein